MQAPPKDDEMNAFERDLVWLGVEDYTGLWDASFAARSILEPDSPEDARAYARRALESLLAKGWVELYVCKEPLNNDSVELVSPDERRRVLEADSSWEIPKPFGRSVRFATTDEGIAANQSDAE
jgi:hypothetical protein